MAWAEENNIDCWEPEDVSAWYKSVEENWKKGTHVDRNGVKHKIREMTTSHIINTIRYFKLDCNVNMLKRELIIRKIYARNNKRRG